MHAHQSCKAALFGQESNQAAANRIDVGNEVIVAGDLPGEPDLQIALRLGDLDAIGGSGSSSGQRSLDSMSEIRQIHTDQGS